MSHHDAIYEAVPRRDTHSAQPRSDKNVLFLSGTDVGARIVARIDDKALRVVNAGVQMGGEAGHVLRDFAILDDTLTALSWPQLDTGIQLTMAPPTSPHTLAHRRATLQLKGKYSFSRAALKNQTNMRYSFWYCICIVGDWYGSPDPHRIELGQSLSR